MWIAIAAVALTIAMMLGPIMLMQPTKRQRRLASLRAAAEAQGLKVRMAPMPDKSARAGEEIAVYSHRWPGEKPLKNTWLLARQSFSHGLHFAGDWDWSSQKTAPEAWHDPLRQALPELPTSVVAVEASAHTLGVYWLERTGDKDPEQVITELSAWIKNLINTLPGPR